MELRLGYKQTVLAGFILQGPSDCDLRVISIGVGTKSLSLDQLQNPLEHSDGAGLQVRDMHAEVLARRGLVRWLYDQVELALQSSSPYLALDQSNAQRFCLQPNFSLHLYSSSQPCGNACIKAWAKCKKPDPITAGPFTCPELPHTRFCLTAKNEGQVAALVKRAARNASEAIEGGEVTSENDEGKADAATSELRRIPPSGTAYPTSTGSPGPPGLLLTCSDKICRWNCLGLQGCLLSAWLAPLYLRSITCGRKFSSVHCERALCCRVNRFESACGQYSAHHPTMLCSSERFDTKSISTSHTDGESEGGIGAIFSEKRCFVWTLSSFDASLACGEVLDGLTGLLHTDAELHLCALGVAASRVSSASIFSRFNALTGSQHALRYDDVKSGRSVASDHIRAYVAAKQKLSSAPFFLSDFEELRQMKKQRLNAPNLHSLAQAPNGEDKIRHYRS